MSEIDRQGIGMLYAGGVGIVVGTFITYTWDPAYAILGASLVVMLGVGYDVIQRMGARS